jgi:hypothetical protein
MNRALVDQIVESVLYEGYMLYPYRPSVKNRQRWTFGGIFPRVFAETHATGDSWTMQTECLVRGSAASTIQVVIRFLHLLDRIVRQLVEPLDEDPGGDEPASRRVERLELPDRCLQSWQEAEERSLSLETLTVESLLGQPLASEFRFSARRQVDPVWHDGKIVALVVREQEPLVVTTELSACEASPGLFTMRLCIANQTPLEDAARKDREQAQKRSLVSTHSILEVQGGAFVSLIDPPHDCQAAAKACRNIGAWPVLVGEECRHDTMLCSPIILYDYPQVAPESPGNLFDGTEIDEILTLRVLTLTDEEKQAAAAVDERTRALLARTESLARDQLMRLHGTIRGLRPVRQETFHG